MKEVCGSRCLNQGMANSKLSPPKVIYSGGGEIVLHFFDGSKGAITLVADDFLTMAWLHSRVFFADQERLLEVDGTKQVELVG